MHVYVSTLTREGGFREERARPALNLPVVSCVSPLKIRGMRKSGAARGELRAAREHKVNPSCIGVMQRMIVQRAASTTAVEENP